MSIAAFALTALVSQTAFADNVRLAGSHVSASPPAVLRPPAAALGGACTGSEFVYLYDDDFAEGGLRTDGTHGAWMNNYVVEGDATVIEAIDLTFVFVPNGTPATVYLWSDPNNDGNPTDAQVLASAAITTIDSAAGVFRVDIPDTYVGEAGTSFFVGAAMAYPDPIADQFPCPLDTSPPQTTGVAWIVGSNAPIDPNDVTNGAIEFALVEDAIGQAVNITVRAVSTASFDCNNNGTADHEDINMGTSLDCNGNCVPDECDITAGTSADCNDNGVPDECELDGNDCNDNGIPDECELDCDEDGIPDDCQEPDVDCDGNGIEDSCQADGTGLMGLYFDNRFWSGSPAVTRIDATIDFPLDFVPPAPLPDDLFSIRWTGSLVPAVTGDYTLIFEHDDGLAFYLDGVKLIDEGTGTSSVTVTLDAGVAYHLRIDYFENLFQQSCVFRWIPPGGSEEVVPTEFLRPLLDADDNGVPDLCDFGDCNGNFVPDNIDVAGGSSLDCDGNGTPDECQPNCDCDDNGLLEVCEAQFANGLVGQYWQSNGGPGNFSERLLVRVDPNIDFNWGDGSPDPLVPNDDFSVRWTGTVTTTAAAGTYTFYTVTDDGLRLWVNEQLIIDEWQAQAPIEHSGTIDLAASTAYLIRMEYREDGGGAEATLSWEPPGEAKVVIPTGALRPMADGDGDGVPDGCAFHDCNDNGMSDLDDIAMGISEDCNGNCIPDECDVVPQFVFGQAHWRFEEAGGTTVVDAGPNGLDGTLNGLPFRAGDVPVDPVPQSEFANTQSLDLSFQNTASGGFFTVPDTGGALSMGNQSFTLEAWVKLEQLSDTSDATQRQYLFQKKPLPSQDGQIDYAFLVQRGNNTPSPNYGNSGSTGREMQLVFGTGAGTTAWGITSSLQIDDLDWHYVAVAFDAGAKAVTFHLDDASETLTFTGNDPHATNNGPLRVGSHQNGVGSDNFFLRGAIDELRISRGLAPDGKRMNEPATSESEDANDNGIPDECEDPCPPDLNDDGMVTVTDLLALLAMWGKCPGCAADFNGDDMVDVVDLLELLAAWGVCP